MPPRPRYIGVSLPPYRKGTKILILVGELEGTECEVQSVEGNAFQMESSRLVVEIEGERCWLHPWNVTPLVEE